MSTETETIEDILNEYPIYLRWGQLIELHRRLGLGGKYIVKQRIKSGQIQRRRLSGCRDHYIRESVIPTSTNAESCHGRDKT